MVAPLAKGSPAQPLPQKWGPECRSPGHAPPPPPGTRGCGSPRPHVPAPHILDSTLPTVLPGPIPNSEKAPDNHVGQGQDRRPSTCPPPVDIALQPELAKIQGRFEQIPLVEGKIVALDRGLEQRVQVVGQSQGGSVSWPECRQPSTAGCRPRAGT